MINIQTKTDKARARKEVLDAKSRAGMLAVKSKNAVRGNQNRKGKRNAIIKGFPMTGNLSGFVEPWVPLFPARTTRRLRYSTNVTLSSASGAVATHVFAANGLFDPDITSTGHQPMGFDQMMLSYNHYCVKTARIRASFKNTTTSVPQACIRLDGAATPITVIDQIIEEGMLVQSALEIKGDYGANKMLTIGIDIAAHQGVNDVVDNPSLQGTAAANPAEISYFHIQMWDSAAVSGTCNVDVEIEFTATFTEPRILTVSQLAILRSHCFFDDDLIPDGPVGPDDSVVVHAPSLASLVTTTSVMSDQKQSSMYSPPSNSVGGSGHVVAVAPSKSRYLPF